jgi:DNA-binding PadR family transcriptional regulator
MSPYFNPNSTPSEQFGYPTSEQIEFLQAIDKETEESLERNTIDILKNIFSKKKEEHIKRILDKLKISGWIDFVKSEPSGYLHVRITEEGQQCLRDYREACERKAQFLK